MKPIIYIFYRHVHQKHEVRSRDPNKSRPSWFSYEKCLRNLIYTIQGDSEASRVKLNVMFDGNIDELTNDFSSNYLTINKDWMQIQFISAGSDNKSWRITLQYILNSTFNSNDIIYILENDYMHYPGWITKTFELFENKTINYVSLYDHKDK